MVCNKDIVYQDNLEDAINLYNNNNNLRSVKIHVHNFDKNFLNEEIDIDQIILEQGNKDSKMKSIQNVKDDDTYSDSVTDHYKKIAPIGLVNYLKMDSHLH